MRRIFLLIIFTLPTLIFSQENTSQIYTISGKILDASTKLPLEDAAIIFKSIDNNEIKFGGITNQRGKFSIDVEKGNYNVSVEFLSYLTKKLNISSVKRDLNLGIFELEIDTEYLSEVEIIGEKKAIEFKKNKFVFNVEKDVAAASGMATDILNHIPSVNVDPSGDITVGGQGYVQVMINGKTSSLSRSLKSLPAGSIQSVEVITNPGSKYKSSSLSVINIILKKGKDEGLNSSITVTGGHKDHYGGLITLNNKTKKINFFTNANYFHRNTILNSEIESEYFENDISTSFLLENSKFNSNTDAFYTTVGLDMYLSKNTTLTTSINYNNLKSKSNTRTFTNIFDVNRFEINSNTRNNNGNFNNEMVDFTVDFNHNFSKEGRQLSSNISHTIDNEEYKNKITNTNIASFINEENIEYNDYERTSSTIDYINPISKNASYSIGYVGDFIKIPFSYEVDNNISKINHYENNHSAFIDYEYERNKLYLSFGLRADFVELKVNYLTLGNNQQNHFNDFSPSASISYSFTDSKSLTLSYRRLLLTPQYKQLQPFEQKYSETSTFIGNPDLSPVYVDSSNLIYSYFGNKFTFSSRLFYTKFNDWWQTVTYETGEQLDGINKIISTYVNLGSVDYYGVNLTSTLKASNHLSFTGNFTLLNFDQSGIFKTVNKANEPIELDYNHSNINGEFSLFTQLKIPNVFNFQTQVKHTLISKAAYSTRKPYTYANASISKDLFEKEASISLTVNDLFLSNETNRDRFDTNYFSKSLIKNKFRTILLSFTYRFNQSKKERKIDFTKKDIKPTY